jgi:hypothetical protein
VIFLIVAARHFQGEYLGNNEAKAVEVRKGRYFVDWHLALLQQRKIALQLHNIAAVWNRTLSS